MRLEPLLPWELEPKPNVFTNYTTSVLILILVCKTILQALFYKVENVIKNDTDKIFLDDNYVKYTI